MDDQWMRWKDVERGTEALTKIARVRAVRGGSPHELFWD